MGPYSSHENIFNLLVQVLTNTILEQTFEIEYLVQHGQCPDCAKLAAKNTWKALIQVRQKVSHKRTFLYLEQLILKHNAQKDTIAIKEVRDGLDFFYSSRSHALRMMDFLASVAPIKYVLPLVLNASGLTCNFFVQIEIVRTDNFIRYTHQYCQFQIHILRRDRSHLQG